MLLLASSLVGCTPEPTDKSTDADADADADTDSDTDSDSDADSDTDSDADSDTDSDTDAGYTLDAWVPCDEIFECSTLRTASAEIAVVRHLADPPTDGLVVMANGGPGSSSIDLLEMLVTYWGPSDPDLWLGLNWIAMDNRGVGRSDPILCADDAWYDELRLLEPVPATAAESAALAASRDAFQQGCLDARSEDELVELGTATYVADIDGLREALGEPTLDLIGFSYGTWVGALYAATHPDRVGRFVLDGVMAPLTTRDAFLASQTAGFTDALERFFDRCEADPACPVNDDPAGVFDRLLADAETAPLAAPSDPWGRSLSRNDLRWAVSSLLYGPDDETFAQALDEARGGDAALLLAAGDDGWGRDPSTGEYSTVYGGYWAIGCLDLPWPEGYSDEDVWAFGAQLELDWPELGSALLTGELNCAGWPVTAPVPSVSAPTAPPLLLVNGLHDPATPWAGAEAMQDALGNGSLLLPFDGDGHVAMFSDESWCSYLQIRSYLLDGTEPTVSSCP
jgi:pimeloyl-ACP methyl ester carboxylesterase